MLIDYGLVSMDWCGLVVCRLLGIVVCRLLGTIVCRLLGAVVCRLLGQVFRTFEGRGWGLRLSDENGAKAGTLLHEYLGEVTYYSTAVTKLYL